MLLHPEILNQNQIDIINKLSFNREDLIYLSGGTALALYLNHRSSVDLDFYSENKFDNNKILINLQKPFKDTER